MHFCSYTSLTDFEQIPVTYSLSLCYCVFMFMQAQSRCCGNRIMVIFSTEWCTFPIVIVLLTISDVSIQTEDADRLHASGFDTITHCDSWSFTDEKR